MALTVPPDESWWVGHAQVYDTVYFWRGGQWVLDSTRDPLRILPTSELRNDLRPFDDRSKIRGQSGYVPMYVARYYWAPGRWVYFGSDQNY